MDDWDEQVRRDQRTDAINEQTKIIIYCTVAIIITLLFLFGNKEEIKSNIETAFWWGAGLGSIYGFFAWPSFRTGIFFAAAAWVIWNGPGLHPRNWTPEMWNILGVLLGIAAASSTLNQWIIHKKDFSKWWQHLKDLD